ncbi:hypothetical protein ACFL08_03920, partial [Patescibacteria group bacterium]
ALLIVAGYLLSKNNVWGVYLSWFFVAVALLNNIISQPNILAIVIIVYFGYWTYKAQKELGKGGDGVSSEETVEQEVVEQNTPVEATIEQDAPIGEPVNESIHEQDERK